jgi:hypothetical protein
LIIDEMRRFCHAPSLRQPCRRSTPVEIKQHHYLESLSFASVPYLKSLYIS